MDEIKETQTIGSPDQIFDAKLEQLVGLTNEEAFLKQTTTELKPNTDPNSIGKTQVLELIQAKMADVKALQAENRLKKNYSDAQNAEKAIMDCQLAIEAIQGNTENTAPLHRVITKIVQDRLNDHRQEAEARKAKQEFPYQKQQTEQTRQMKDKLANNLLTRVVSVQNWKNQP